MDYVQAFPQGPIERELFMEIPKGFDVDEIDDQQYSLRLKVNVYG